MSVTNRPTCLSRLRHDLFLPNLLDIKHLPLVDKDFLAHPFVLNKRFLNELAATGGALNSFSIVSIICAIILFIVSCIFVHGKKALLLPLFCSAFLFWITLFLLRLLPLFLSRYTSLSTLWLLIFLFISRLLLLLRLTITLIISVVIRSRIKVRS